VAYFCYGFSAEQIHTLLLKIFARHPMGIFATASSMTTKHIALAQRMGVDNIVLYSVKPLEHARTIFLPTQSLGRLAAEHLLERGKQVPRDVAVVGTDDISFSTWMRPSLTTIRFDSITLAQRAVEMLVRRHTGQPLPEELSRPLMPQLIARGST